MTLNLATIAAELSRDLHPIGGALTDTATHLAELNDLLPTRGDARLEYDELCTIIAYITTLYRLADERLVETVFLLEHAQAVPNPMPLNGTSDTANTLQATRVGTVIPAHRPTS